jgi:hypothetical protein
METVGIDRPTSNPTQRATGVMTTACLHMEIQRNTGNPKRQRARGGRKGGHPLNRGAARPRRPLGAGVAGPDQTRLRHGPPVRSADHARPSSPGASRAGAWVSLRSGGMRLRVTTIATKDERDGRRRCSLALTIDTRGREPGQAAARDEHRGIGRVWLSSGFGDSWSDQTPEANDQCPLSCCNVSLREELS